MQSEPVRLALHVIRPVSPNGYVTVFATAIYGKWPYTYSTSYRDTLCFLAISHHRIYQMWHIYFLWSMVWRG
eukprot:95520-Ditylum_brightwellii.AAC.1